MSLILYYFQTLLLILIEHGMHRCPGFPDDGFGVTP